MNQIDIVVPDGSMQKVIIGLFAKAGLPVVIEKRRTKEGRVGVDWIKRVAFQRPQEIPHYLKSGHFDIAIVGVTVIVGDAGGFHQAGQYGVSPNTFGSVLDGNLTGQGDYPSLGNRVSQGGIGSGAQGVH